MILCWYTIVTTALAVCEAQNESGCYAKGRALLRKGKAAACSGAAQVGECHSDGWSLKTNTAWLEVTECHRYKESCYSPIPSIAPRCDYSSALGPAGAEQLFSFKHIIVSPCSERCDMRWRLEHWHPAWRSLSVFPDRQSCNYSANLKEKLRENRQGAGHVAWYLFLGN